MIKIAVVEDDVILQAEIVDLLEKENYTAVSITDFDTDVTAQLLTLSPELVLLDINLPKQSGFEICRELKKKANIPVLVLTSRDRLNDELHALGLGADDYLTKPFHKEKLLARIRNLLKRFHSNPALVDAGAFQFDRQSFVLFVGQRSAVLPANEGRILATLVEKQGEVVSKEELSQILWDTTEFIDENAIQVNLARLRKTLRPFGLDQQIETVRGQGYRLKEVDQR